MPDRISAGFPAIQPDDRNYRFTEGIDYGQTGPDSIWGSGYGNTLALLEHGAISGGKVLNLAAGDGRYNDILLQHADTVVASDIDAGALDKLRKQTPVELRDKLSVVAFDLTKNFPFTDESFDTVFCTGILHLLPPEVLNRSINEILRVLKPEGAIILEFPSNIRRVAPDGSLITFGNEPSYSAAQAKDRLKELLGDTGEVIEEDVIEDCMKADPPFMFNSTIVLWNGFKSSGSSQ
ncbi:hypothetical protein A3J15_01090 [Candidatus Roizmanbacteria bacterium RIFCSPLOWO2_02_FULL_38_10]|uniref:Methyltransferase type 11 domain-containing protein n=1 Tax=Candidatus Roizmanbacteria bacterium RIFCSPLOWO2_02_FULL_38_10 TaxID=1802074 RepID=A0A1F7JPE1_9BACT|nr:MAG: hypothetical protein A3J15_01090 [Candidatus Roizmanbacteria bacterium RIFCSPLOWO2_02_FULL_38_10]